MLVRFNEGKSSAVLDYLDNIWTAEVPHWPLSYSFLDQRLESLYQDDKRVMNIVGSFAGLAIFLSTLGLIGLAMFTANARTREIGIRKVLGSSVRDIIRLISNEFGVLALIANLLGFTCGMVLYQQMAGKLCLPRRYKLAGIYNTCDFSLPVSLGCCRTNILQGSNVKSNEYIAYQGII